MRVITRASTQVECNCVLQTFTSRQITTCGIEKRDLLVDDMESRVPVVMNDKDIKEGEELRVYWLAQSLPKRKTQGAKKSWVQAAEAVVKRRKVQASSNGGVRNGGAGRLRVVRSGGQYLLAPGSVRVLELGATGTLVRSGLRVAPQACVRS